MSNALKNELAGLAGELARLEKVRAMLTSLYSEQRELEGREEELYRVLCRENEDVHRLEKTSAAAIFYSIIGQKTERLNKERDEAYAAKLKYDALTRQLDDCRSRISSLESERAALEPCIARYEEVFRHLQEELEADPRYAERICALEKAVGENDSQLREISEAVDAGGAVMGQISVVERELSDAEGWGTWDVFGGGLIADVAKHSHLDEAQAAAEYLQVLLSRFRTELADVHISADMSHVAVDGFLRFADYFFDGLIADWSVLSRIHDSQESVRTVREQVQNAIFRLESLRAARESDAERLRRELEELVKNA